MEPRIEILSEKKLVGMHMRMTMAGNRTMELWRGFMPRRMEIRNNVNADLISMQVYDAVADVEQFNVHAAFEKWAAVEVSDFDVVPDGMDTFVLPGGLYAVFLHIGAASTWAKAFQYIFGTWLPNSEYRLDDRPHFEVLGAKYKNDDAASEEEIWVPIRRK